VPPHTRRAGSRGGVRLDVVSKQLGHASIAVTADVYGHPDDEAAAKAARLMADVFDGKARG
jgi:integrase